MTEKYVKLSDVKKKLNYTYRVYGVSQKIKQTISNSLGKIPYTVKGELETTIEAEPVKQGKWKKIQNFARCSECKHEVNWGSKDFLSPYCPNCGAKMEGGEERT